MLKTNSLPTHKVDNVKDLSKLTTAELTEMKTRQEAMLNNKKFLARLPDKGARLQESMKKLDAEIAQRSYCVDDVAEQIARMQLKSKVDALEWQDKSGADSTADVLDSDDEPEVDELRVLAQGQMHVRQTKVLPPEPSLITADDLAEIESFKQPTVNASATTEHAEPETSTTATQVLEVDAADKKLTAKLQRLLVDKAKETALENPHARYLMDKTTKAEQTPHRAKFKPYSTTISNVHDPVKDRQRKRGDKWEVTAATVPPLKSNGVLEMPLAESLQQQIEYANNCKRLMADEAQARLVEKIARASISKLPDKSVLRNSEAFTQYREPAIEGHLTARERAHEDYEEDVLALNEPMLYEFAAK